MSQKCWCSAISALYIEPTAILQKSDSEPSPPTTHVLSRSTCALLAQAVSESTSHTLTCKKLWIPLEIRHSTKFPRICLGIAEPNHPSKVSVLWPAPEAVTYVKRVQWSCAGAKEQDLTHADICTLRWDPNSEDLPSPPSCQHFQDKRWTQKAMGWGEQVTTLWLN